MLSLVFMVFLLLKMVYLKKTNILLKIKKLILKIAQLYKNSKLKTPYCFKKLRLNVLICTY